MSGLPEPPAGGRLAPVPEIMPAGTRLVRIHDRDVGALQFNASSWPVARFRPIGVPVVPTLYAGEDEDTALAEGLFHDVPIRPGLLRQYPLAGLDGRVMSEMKPTRDLNLIQLRDFGLQRLGLTHGELIETPAAAYEWTARWAQALHAAEPKADGLIWMSRRLTGRAAVMLWRQRERMRSGDLAVVAPALPLWEAAGRELVLESAARAGIRLIA